MGRRRSHSLGLFHAQVKKKGKTWFESARKLRYGISLLVWRVWKMVWKRIQTHLSFVLFLVDLICFEIVLILFWFGLELSMDKDQKCVKKHVGILRD